MNQREYDDFLDEEENYIEDIDKLDAALADTKRFRLPRAPSELLCFICL